MSQAVIACEEIGKQYRIGQRERYKTLREAITETMAAPFRRLGSALRLSKGEAANGHATIWALKGVSFEIQQGEVVGVIGRNGAGKSTLLKVLSRITEPTEGHARIRGRLSSLLEVGTGFHPELTGRENVYLNGAILGMSRAEIARKFDEIVAFAEIDEFIDTPVKRYSSGMYVRLAFAVAAHMETEVLLVDEVLAVGDAAFQKKCLGKMGEVTKKGRTVLFVSHSMPSIQRLCGRALLLDEGLLVADGRVDKVIERYLACNTAQEFVATFNGEQPQITRASAKWTQQEGIRLEVAFASPFRLRPPLLGISMYDVMGSPVWGTNARFDPQATLPDSMTAGTITVEICTEPLRSDTYYFSLWLADQFQDYCSLERVLSVEVGGGSDDVWRPPRSFIGNVRLDTRWQYEPAHA
ncbi:MAG TPA: ABC transporter ATP-binding protein [Terriglobales bacterium]|jgi:lipopolysaccharide transport system ATP-binding protein|nr:ABC transporter ATP-binding protein [Terriglobales bacterium]